MRALVVAVALLPLLLGCPTQRSGSLSPGTHIRILAPGEPVLVVVSHHGKIIEGSDLASGERRRFSTEFVEYEVLTAAEIAEIAARPPTRERTETEHHMDELGAQLRDAQDRMPTLPGQPPEPTPP